MENISALTAQRPNDIQSSEKWAVSRKNSSNSNERGSVKSPNSGDNSNEAARKSFSKALKQAVEKEGKDENANSIENRSGKLAVRKTKGQKNGPEETEAAGKKESIPKKNQKHNWLKNAGLMLNDDKKMSGSEKAKKAGLDGLGKKPTKKTSRKTADSPDFLKTNVLAGASQKAQIERAKKEGKNGDTPLLDKNKASRSSLKTAESLNSRSGKVEVVDLRMASRKSGVEAVSGREKQNGKKTDRPAVFHLDGNNAPGNTLATAETSIEVPSRFGSQNDVSRTAADLARKLDAQAGGDIVKQVKVVLQKADAGEIRINLHPDNLGRVKVQIKVENHILKGQIFVESAAAREAFGSALEGLKTKLIESGFSGADLELTWNNEGDSSFDREQHNHKPMRNKSVGLENFENMIGTIDASADAADSYVNMVV